MDLFHVNETQQGGQIWIFACFINQQTFDAGWAA